MEYARPLQYVDASQKDHQISLNSLKKKSKYCWRNENIAQHADES